MVWQEIAPETSVTNYTTVVTHWLIRENSAEVAIEGVGMQSNQVFLDAAPSRNRMIEEERAHPDVIASLRRSLRENADIWEELSRR